MSAFVLWVGLWVCVGMVWTLRSELGVCVCVCVVWTLRSELGECVCVCVGVGTCVGPRELRFVCFVRSVCLRGRV